MNDVTFCFLVTQDLVKEHIWREWFEGLEKLQFKFSIVVHCSPCNKNKVTSEWLIQHLLPDDYICKNTIWDWLLTAMLLMYDYAVKTHPAAWYTLHSEKCVPVVSPQKFIEYFNKYQQNSFISYSRIWWNPFKVNRANLKLLPPTMHLVHSMWCILCHEDLSQMINLSKNNEKINEILSILIRGPTADESYAAVLLFNINNFKNVINKNTTLVDWKRTPNGSNPYTFNEWSTRDEDIVRNIRKSNSNEYMFMRKIGPTFPDHVLRNYIFNNFQ